MRHFSAAVALILVVALPSLAVAQQGTSTIRGRAMDEQDAALPGVNITVTHEETGLFRETITGGDGMYSVSNLVAGRYRIRAELQGFGKLTREDVLLVAATTQTIDLQMKVGAVTETLTVTGLAPQVDLTSAKVGGNVSLEEVQVIPSVSHTVIGYLQVIPGVIYTPGSTKPSLDAVTVNGAAAGIQHFLDGGANFSGVFAASYTRVTVPSEVVQEVVMVTSQMPAEYGERSGAVINTITKQGTNALHGSVYGSYISDGLTAANYFQKRDNLAKPPAQRRLAGFSFGGPIVREKVFFFGLLEQTFQGKSNAVTYPTNPDKSFTSQAVAKGFDTFGRVDHQLNTANTYAVRFLARSAKCTRDPGCRAGGVGTSIATGGATLPTLTDEWELDTLLVGNYNHVFGKTKLNVLTFSAPRQTIQTGIPGDSPSALSTCVPCLPPTLRYLSFDDQAPYFFHQRWEPVYRVENSFGWFVPGGNGFGSHDWKFGGLYSFARHRQENPDDENGIFGFPSNKAFNPGDPSTYPERLTIRNGPQRSNPTLQLGGLYAQDKWQIGRNLTLNLGVRYEIVFARTPNDFNPLFSDRTSYPIDRNNIQPRLGLAYGSGDGKSVLRGGFGQFFQSPTFSDTIDPYWRQGVYGTGLVLNFPASVPDPGPAAGRLPTDPFLVNGPVVNRALLDQLFPAGSAIRSTSAVYLDNPDRELPATRQATVGYERELRSRLSVGVDYVHIWGDHGLVQYDLNPGIRASTSRTAAIVRTDLKGIANSLGLSPFATSVFTFQNVGRERYDGLNLSFEKRFSQSWGSRVSYTLARGYSDSAQSNYQLMADRHPELAWGPTARKHVMSLSGRWDLPWVRGLGVSGTFRAMSGAPFTITNTNVDADRNGILADTLSAGTYSGTGADALTLENKGGQGGAIGPAFAELDLRAAYRLKIGTSRTLEISADAFNVTNEPNFSNPTGDQRQPTFLVPTALVSGGIPRQLQVSVRLGF